MGKILFAVGSGLGNIVQTLPAFHYANKKYGHITVWCASSSYPEFVKLLYGDLTEVADIPKGEYEGQIMTYHVSSLRDKRFPVLSNDVRGFVGKMSEVELNLRCVGDGYTDGDFSVASVFSGIDKKSESDVLIHNGYNKTTERAREVWEAKSYPYWEKVAKTLRVQGLTVGSIGSTDEYVEGTANLTGKPIQETIGLLKGCKVFLSNDTGTYHLANVIGVPNVVVFTFTCNRKNYDVRFHKYSTVVRREDLDCSPCQFAMKHKKAWLLRKGECKWMCREIDPDVIVNIVMETL